MAYSSSKPISHPTKFNPEKNYYECGDHEIGFAYLCEPVPHSNEDLARRIPFLITHPFPTGSLLQILLFSSCLPSGTNLIRSTVATNPSAGYDRLHDARLVISLKIRIPLSLGLQDRDSFSTNWEKILFSALSDLQLKPKACTPEFYSEIINGLFPHNRNSHLSLQKQKVLESLGVDQHEELLSDNYFFQALSFNQTSPLQGLNSLQVFSKLPPAASKTAIALDIYFPDPAIRNEVFFKNRMYKSRLLNVLNPDLHIKRQITDEFIDSISLGYRPVQVKQTVLFFSDVSDHVKKSSDDFLKIVSEKNLDFNSVQSIESKLFHFLPLCGSNHSKTINQHILMTTNEASKFLPVYSDWKGHVDPDVSLVTKTHQIFSLNLRKYPGKNNALLLSSAGGGKTQFCHEIINSLLKKKRNNVWVVDIGNSYKTLSLALNGHHHTPEINDPITFPLISHELSDIGISFHTQLLTTISLICQQGNTTLDTQIKSKLEKSISDLLLIYGSQITFHDIIKTMVQHPDKDLNEIAVQLAPFDTMFTGSHSFEFCKQFTVVDLIRMFRHSNHSQILRVAFYNILNQILLSASKQDPGKNTYIVLDECDRQLIQIPFPAFNQITNLLAKYNASMILTAQSVIDFTKTETGKRIFDFIGYSFIFYQQLEFARYLKELLCLSDEQLKLIAKCYVSIREPKHAQFLLKTPDGFELLRYFPDPELINIIQKNIERSNEVLSAITTNKIIKV